MWYLQPILWTQRMPWDDPWDTKSNILYIRTFWIYGSEVNMMAVKVLDCKETTHINQNLLIELTKSRNTTAFVVMCVCLFFLYLTDWIQNWSTVWRYPSQHFEDQTNQIDTVHPHSTRRKVMRLNWSSSSDLQMYIVKHIYHKSEHYQSFIQVTDRLIDMVSLASLIDKTDPSMRLQEQLFMKVNHFLSSLLAL